MEIPNPDTELQNSIQAFLSCRETKIGVNFIQFITYTVRSLVSISVVLIVSCVTVPSIRVIYIFGIGRLCYIVTKGANNFYVCIFIYFFITITNTHKLTTTSYWLVFIYK